MILTFTSESELLMDEEDITERMLLTSFSDDKPPHDNSFSTTLSEETTPSLMDEDDLGDKEFLDTDKVGDMDPAKQASATPSSTTEMTEKEEDNNTHNDADEDVKGIPGKFDVLCGQSRICANHTGNRRFQIVLDIYAPKYVNAISKQEKMEMTKEIVACIDSAGGRFLKYRDGLWQAISTVTARDKVSHALRTKVASWKRQQQEQEKPVEVTPVKRKPTHRRAGSGNTPRSRSRRTSASSVATSASDIATTSFDGNDAASSSLMEDLLKTQKEIFASLTQSEHTTKSTTSSRKQQHPLLKRRDSR